MSHYQFVLFSGKDDYYPTGKLKKREDVITVKSSNSSYTKSEREVDSSSPSSHTSSSSSSSRKQLIVFPTENSNRVIECEQRNQQICIESKPPRKRELPSNILQMQLQRQRFTNASATNLGGKCANSTLGKAKIPRPANAFMLFANEWRKKLALENPRESNKDISVRLGVLWKNMGKDVKEKYFSLARQVDAEHKRKYPDYVYNPKEARLRKAMREQSRELSRQSILQSAVTSTSGNASTTGANDTNGTNVGNGIASSSNFINQPMPCTSPASTSSVSSLPGTSSYNSDRMINSWFPIGHTPSSSHIKPMLSHRVMQTHQRTFDKSKEVLRKQAECAGAFPAASATACYPGEFTVRGASTQVTSDTSIGGLESNDYCSGIGEFSDAQKWHPYQSTPTVYHPRSGSMSKIANRHGMQSINTHGHGPWNQFCGVPLFTMTAQNSAIRGPRQMAFLQEQHERHCNFPEEMPINYMTNKVDVGHRLQSGYSQHSYQQENEKCAEDASRWEPQIPIDPGMSNLATLSRDSEPRAKEPSKPNEEIKEYQEDESPSRQTPSKQPLPGFHQAFGSTEIGKFSRSQYFANIIGESGGNYVTLVDVPRPRNPDWIRPNPIMHQDLSVLRMEIPNINPSIDQNVHLTRSTTRASQDSTKAISSTSNTEGDEDDDSTTNDDKNNRSTD
ncbi:uncharacterized protein [Chelonus insularis]|uniref:uncharacterized protein n=1 Tax=Chelonus insularis TaxID=460826 RepID=UPI001589797E|nr:uncharacterized protein LOC118069665 [Chelonus insularis]